MAGHYEIEPETATRAKGVVRVYWVEPGPTGGKSHLWNMADRRLYLLGEAITAYRADHPEVSDDDAPASNGGQAVPLRPRIPPDDQLRGKRGPDGPPPS
jgi:hypothetical protein